MPNAKVVEKNNLIKVICGFFTPVYVPSASGGSDIKELEIKGEWHSYEWWHSGTGVTHNKEGYLFKKENIHLDFSKDIRIQIFKNNELIYDKVMYLDLLDNGRLKIMSVKDRTSIIANPSKTHYKIKGPWPLSGELGVFWFATDDIEWVESDDAVLKLMYVEGNEWTRFYQEQNWVNEKD